MQNYETAHAHVIIFSFLPIPVTKRTSENSLQRRVQTHAKVVISQGEIVKSI